MDEREKKWEDRMKAANPSLLDLSFEFECQIGNLPRVKKLVEMGADIHNRNGFALRSAASKGHLEVVEYLLDVGVDPFIGNGGALSLATFGGFFEIASLLEERMKAEAEKIKAYVTDPKTTMADLRKPYQDTPETALARAARAGVFDFVIEKSIKSGDAGLSLQDFIAGKKPLIDILGDANILSAAFDPRLWYNKTSDLEELWMLVKKDHKAQVDFDSVVSAVNRNTLKTGNIPFKFNKNPKP